MSKGEALTIQGERCRETIHPCPLCAGSEYCSAKVNKGRLARISLCSTIPERGPRRFATGMCSKRILSDGNVR
jgi:hypothetical protein